MYNTHATHFNPLSQNLYIIHTRMEVMRMLGVARLYAWNFDCSQPPLSGMLTMQKKCAYKIIYMYIHVHVRMYELWMP